MAEPDQSDPRKAELEADEAERRWLTEVYRGDERQLTARAVVIGMVIGMFLCASNMYVVLKTGWSVGVTVTASIMAWALFAMLRSLKVPGCGLSVLENNSIATVASAAGYMTGGGNMAALPALLILTDLRPDAALMVFWFAAIGILGVFAAIPIKRQLINRERLPFPTGIATAETLQALHAHGGSGAAKARALGLGALVGAVLTWTRDAKASWMPFNLPSKVGWPFDLQGRPAGDWTLAFEPGVLMFGAGALMSYRTGWSMLIGALVTYVWLAPWMVADGIITMVSYKAIAAWAVWPGAAVLVSSGLTSFAFQWRSVAKAFSELMLLFAPGKKAADDPVAAVEVPQRWFPIGFVAVGPVVVFLCWFLFGIPWWAAVLALPLSVVMGVIAARVTGETDVTPTKALGPVTQLIYGGVLPQQLVPNIMSANVTGGVGLHAADLLTVLKTGYLVGAKPRLQFFGQLFGVLAGAAVVVPLFNYLITDRAQLGSEAWPAPSALVWAGVSKVLVEGLDKLHPGPLGLAHRPRRGHRPGGARGEAAKAAQEVGALGVGARHRDGHPRVQLGDDVPRGAGRRVAATQEGREARRRHHHSGGVGVHRRREPAGHLDRPAGRLRRDAEVTPLERRPTSSSAAPAR